MGPGRIGVKMAETARASVSAVWAGGEYGPLAARLEPAAAALVDAVGVGRGDRLLDVAAGTGNVALLAARHGATVTASDITPRMLELGRARAAAQGLALQWVEADAQDLPFPDAAFDRATSAFGIIFAPQPAAAVAELHRVVRPGGRIGLTAWPADGHMARMTDVVRRFFPPPAPSAPDPFAWGSAPSVRGLLAQRFGDVQVRTAELAWTFGSPAAAREFLERHSPSHVAAATALGADATRLFDALERFYATEPDAVADYLLITATRPG